MGTRNRQRDEFWQQAKETCGLTDRQVAMAKQLGMNPKKLQRLRPSPSQPWKQPVGAFVEELYAKRFKPPPEDSRDVDGLAMSLACHFANLQLDVENALADRCVTRELLRRIAGDLRRTAREIETGAHVSDMPYDDFQREAGDGPPF